MDEPRHRIYDALGAELDELTSIWPDLREVVYTHHNNFEQKYAAIQDLANNKYHASQINYDIYLDLISMGGEPGDNEVNEVWDAYRDAERIAEQYLRAAEILVRMRNHKKLRVHMRVNKKWKKRLPHDIYRHIGTYL